MCFDIGFAVKDLSPCLLYRYARQVRMTHRMRAKLDARGKRLPDVTGRQEPLLDRGKASHPELLEYVFKARLPIGRRQPVEQVGQRTGRKLAFNGRLDRYRHGRFGLRRIANPEARRCVVESAYRSLLVHNGRRSVSVLLTRKIVAGTRYFTRIGNAHW